MGFLGSQLLFIVTASPVPIIELLAGGYCWYPVLHPLHISPPLSVRSCIQIFGHAGWPLQVFTLKIITKSQVYTCISHWEFVIHLTVTEVLGTGYWVGTGAKKQSPSVGTGAKKQSPSVGTGAKKQSPSVGTGAKKQSLSVGNRG